MILLWFLSGVVFSLAALASQWWMVSRLAPGARKRAPFLFSITFALRLLLAGLLLFLALKQGILSVLFAFTGMLCGRWVSLVFLNHRGEHIWKVGQS